MSENSKPTSQQGQRDEGEKQKREKAQMKIDPSSDSLEKFIKQLKDLNEELNDKYEVIEQKQQSQDDLIEKCNKQRERKDELERLIREKKQILVEKEQEINLLQKHLQFSRKYYDDQVELKYEEVQLEEDIKKLKFKELKYDLNKADKLMQYRIKYQNKLKEEQE